jgi:hypothetical protein
MKKIIEQLKKNYEERNALIEEWEAIIELEQLIKGGQYED